MVLPIIFRVSCVIVVDIYFSGRLATARRQYLHFPKFMEKERTQNTNYPVSFV